MWLFPLIAAIAVWSDAEHDILEPPWQWGRIIAVVAFLLIATVIYVVRGDE